MSGINESVTDVIRVVPVAIVGQDNNVDKAKVSLSPIIVGEWGILPLFPALKRDGDSPFDMASKSLRGNSIGSKEYVFKKVRKQEIRAR
jgi:hypothetical protein